MQSKTFNNKSFKRAEEAPIGGKNGRQYQPGLQSQESNQKPYYHVPLPTSTRVEEELRQHMERLKVENERTIEAYRKGLEIQTNTNLAAQGNAATKMTSLQETIQGKTEENYNLKLQLKKL